MDMKFDTIRDGFAEAASFCAKEGKKAAVGVALVFSLAAIAPEAAAEQPVTPPGNAAENTQAQFDPRGLWKTERFDSVVTLEDCPPGSDQELCSRIWWVNPKDHEIFEWFGSGNKTRYEITDRDVLSLCGMKADITANATGLNQWKGKLYAPGQHITLTIEVEMPDPDTAKLVEYVDIPFISAIKERETWRRVGEDDPRYPRCAPPKP